MANVFVNSTNAAFVRLEDVSVGIIEPRVSGAGFALMLGTHPDEGSRYPTRFEFEVGSTIEAVQALATPLVTALNE